MSRQIVIELPDDVYDTVRAAAEACGERPAEWVAAHLPEWLRGVRGGEARSAPPVPDGAVLTPEETRSVHERLLRSEQSDRATSSSARRR
jgi:hypothetical protein